MPIHDWARVSAGSWHDFHLAWISEIRKALNSGLLPPEYYALAEQATGSIGPDVLTLQAAEPQANEQLEGDESGGLAVAVAPPKTRLMTEIENTQYSRKQRRLVIHHSSGDRIIALLELVSPGNKASKNALRSFVEKAAEAWERGYHLLIIDLFPPGKRDPSGLHNEILAEMGENSIALPPGEPLTLAAYSAGHPKRAYVEPAAVGAEFIDMPLFLTPETYVNVPLEATYREAYAGVPKRWKDVLEGRSSATR